MSGQCQNCKHWIEQTTDGEFDLYAWPQGWGLCALTESRGQEAKQPTRAVAMDFEGFIAALSTSPLFGCVQWEAKE